jgi:hypothetical protein
LTSRTHFRFDEIDVGSATPGSRRGKKIDPVAALAGGTYANQNEAS